MNDPRPQIDADLKDAMRAKDRQRTTVLRMALNAIKQVEIDDQRSLSPEEAVTILQREIKKRRDSIDEARQLNRADLAEENEQEIAILQAYLPAQLSREEIAELARAAITQSGAASPRDMGKVMGILMPQVKGKADGKLVNEVVRELLAG